MHSQAAAEKDRAAPLAPPAGSSMPWRVREVRALSGQRLLVRVADGLSGSVDLSALIASPAAGVFMALRDGGVVEQVHVAHGAVMWPGELDLAPDAMHAAIKAHGEWRLT